MEVKATARFTIFIEDGSEPFTLEGSTTIDNTDDLSRLIGESIDRQVPYYEKAYASRTEAQKKEQENNMEMLREVRYVQERLSELDEEGVSKLKEILRAHKGD